MELIVKRLPESWEALHLYAIGDVHVGSPEFDEKAIKKKIDIIKNDPVGVVSICGDLADYALKNSKSNVYLATMSPKEQQSYVKYLFEPIKHKIISATSGNHEERLTKEVGICPLYDLCVLWGCEDVYRENVAIVKLMFGQYNNGRRQHVFCGITTHGSPRNKHKKFIAGFDGIDFAISGHTHTPEYSPHGKIRVNSNNETVNHVAYKEIVVDAHLKVGGYGLKKEYEIAPPPELQYLELKAERLDRNHNMKKVINYHTIQI